MNESYSQYRPVLSVVVRSARADDWKNLLRAVNLLEREDPLMRISTEPAESCIVLEGNSDLHLRTICDRLEREFGIPLETEKPTVILLETIRKHSEAEAKYIRQVGGRGQYSHVKLEIEPGRAGSGYQFADQSPNDKIPRRFVESVRLGIQEAMRAGVLAGNEMVDVRVVLRGGSYHSEDSTEMAFQIAAAMAFKEAARKANPIVLEPIMSVRVCTRPELAGAVMGDLNSRRGQIENIESHSDSIVIHGLAPLRELLGYEVYLRGMTQGRASYDMQFARYDPSPNNGDTGPGEIGVHARKPKSPGPKSGFTAAEPE